VVARRRAVASDDVLSVEQFAESLPDKYLNCRELGHTWRHWTVEYDGSSRSYLRQLRCAGCKTVRKQLLDASADVIKNSYDYSAGYLANRVEKGVSLHRSAFRLEAIVRTMNKQGERQAS
jgi:hypothetical protein